MAERTNTLMDQKVVGVSGYLSVYLNPSSIDLSAYLSIFLSIYLSESVVYLSFYLSIYPSIYLSVGLPVYPSICLSIYLSVCLSVGLSVCLSLCLSVSLYLSPSVCPSVHLSICLSVYLSIYPSIYLSTYRSIYLSNYPSNARLHVATSFAAQRRALFRHLHLQKWSQRRFSTTACTSKCASRHNSVHFFHHLSSQKCSGHGVLLAFWLQNMLRATTSSNELPQALRTRNASHLDFQMCRGAMHFLNISTSKSAPKLKCF